MFGSLKDIFRQIRICLIKHKVRAKESLDQNGSTVIVAPHPDDEVIGCGGLIARLCSEGNAPHVVILTGGEGSHRGCCDIDEKEIIENRHSLTLNAAKKLGLPEQNIHCLKFRDGHISSDMTSEKAEELKSLISELKPDTIFVPHWGEGWRDHVNAARMVKEITPSDINIYEYCVWMWYYNVWKLDWKNAYQLKLSKEEHRRKLEAINEYVKPCAPCGKPWSGVLPKVFLDANKWNIELYFKSK